MVPTQWQGGTFTSESAGNTKAFYNPPLSKKFPARNYISYDVVF